MPLTIVPASLPDTFDLKSGDMVFGRVELLPKRGLPTDGKWAWAVSQGAGGGADHGACPTKEQACQMVEAAFQAWLVWVNLRESVAIARKAITAQHTEPCPHCKGEAKIPVHGGLKFKTCPWCNGTGLKDRPKRTR